MPHIEYYLMKEVPLSKNEIEQAITKYSTHQERLVALGISSSTFYTKCHKLGIQTRIKTCNENYFETIDSEEKAYWLGFLFADGCIGDYDLSQKMLTLKLAIKDRHHLVRFVKCLDASVNIHDSKLASYVRLYSDKLCNDLISLGCTPRKSLTLEYPQIPSDMDSHFIRGYLDGDGCISRHGPKNRKGGPRVTILGTEAFLQKMQNVIVTHTKVSKIDIRSKKQTRIFVYNKNGYQQVRDILDWIYKESNIWLERKREKYESCR